MRPKVTRSSRWWWINLGMKGAGPLVAFMIPITRQGVHRVGGDEFPL